MAQPTEGGAPRTATADSGTGFIFAMAAAASASLFLFLPIVLLVVPYRLFKAAARRLGSRQAVPVVGGLVAIWHALVGVYWAWASTAGFSDAPVGDVLWYPIAFGIAAAIATAFVNRRAAVVPVALVGVLALL